jgi:RNA polymerase sigma-70 factor (ECF subfamily)
VTFEQRGDDELEASCDAFCRDNADFLQNYVRRRVPDRQAVSDICQETWRAFVPRWHVYRTYEDPLNPLVTIANNRVIDWFRSRHRRPEEYADDSAAQLRDALAYRHRISSDADIRIDLERAIADLPARQRQALQLRYLDDLTWRCVGEEMRITADSARKNATAGLQKLNNSPKLTGYHGTFTGNREV